VTCMKVCGRASSRRGQGRVLAVDRTPDGDADDVEERASGRRLPRDDPGTEGSSSRADSRAGAAAANEASGGQTEAKPGGDTAEITVKASGKSLREHIDPVGAESNQKPLEGSKAPFERAVRDKDAPWTDGADTFDDLPTGEKLVEPDEDERSKADKFRRKGYEKAGDIQDGVQKGVNGFDKIFGPRPTGHAEVRADSGPTAVDAHHSTIDPGSAATALMALGIVGAELFRKGREKIKGIDDELDR
jgi:hypothetical protein